MCLLSLCIFGVILGVLCGSQSTECLVSAGFSWGFSLFSVSKGGNAFETENSGFLLSSYISGVLPAVLCGSQSTQCLGSAGFSWGFSVFSVSKMGNAVECENYCFLLSLYNFGVLPGFPVILSPGFCRVLLGALLLQGLKNKVACLCLYNCGVLPRVVCGSQSIHSLAGFCRVLLGVLLFPVYQQG